MSITIRSALTMAAPALALLVGAPLQAQEEGGEPQRARVRLEKRDAETKKDESTTADGNVDLRAVIDRAIREALGGTQAKDAPKADAQQREVRVEKRIENGGEPQVRVWVNGEEVDADEAPHWVEIAEGDDHPHGAKILRIKRDGDGEDVDLAKILEKVHSGDVHEHLHGVLEHIGDLGDLDVDVDVDVEEILEESLGQLRGIDGSQFKVMVKGLEGLKGLEKLEGLGELKALDGLKALEGLKVLGGPGGAFEIKIQSDECEDCDEECEECCEEEEDVQVLRVGGNVLKLGGPGGQNVFRFESGDGPHGAIAIIRGDDEDGDARELRFGGNVIKLDGDAAQGGNRRVLRFGGQGNGPQGMAVIEVHEDDEAAAAPARILRTMRQGGANATPHMIWRTRASGGDEEEQVFAREVEADSGDVQEQIEALRAEIKALKQRLKELKQELKRGESV